MMQSKPQRREGFDVIILVTPEVAGRPTPKLTSCYSHYKTKLKFAIFSRQFIPPGSQCTAAAAILFEEIQWASSPPTPTPHVLVCVWCQMSCCKLLKLGLEFIFAARHTEPWYTKLWRHNDLIYAHYYHWCFCQQIQLFQAWRNNGQRQSGNSAHVQRLQRQQWCAKLMLKYGGDTKLYWCWL